MRGRFGGEPLAPAVASEHVADVCPAIGLALNSDSRRADQPAAVELDHREHMAQPWEIRSGFDRLIDELTRRLGRVRLPRHIACYPRVGGIPEDVLQILRRVLAEQDSIPL